MNFRTDLALEVRENLEGSRIDGVECTSFESAGAEITRLRVTDRRGEEILGKPRGEYITVQSQSFARSSRISDELIDAVAQELSRLLIERVAAVAGGVVLCDIQLGEVIVGKLDLRAVENLEAHGDKNILGLVERLVHRMPVTQLDGGSGDGHVDGLGLQSGLHGLFFQLGADGFDFFLNGGADVVRVLTHDGALLCGQLAHRLQNAGQLALLAQKAHAQFVHGGGVGRLGNQRVRALPDVLQCFLHTVLSFVCFAGRSGKRKSPAPAL